MGSIPIVANSLIMPRKLKYRKAFKGKLPIGKSNSQNCEIIMKKEFTVFSLQATEPGLFSTKHLDSCKATITRVYRLASVPLQNSFLTFRLIPAIPVTAKPSEVRMGKGKGAVTHYVARVTNLQVLMEIYSTHNHVAHKALLAVQKRLPFASRLIHTI
eukprot:Opistho-2@20352